MHGRRYDIMSIPSNSLRHLFDKELVYWYIDRNVYER
jgi:hypothetical protein